LLVAFFSYDNPKYLKHCPMSHGDGVGWGGEPPPVESHGSKLNSFYNSLSPLHLILPESLSL
jgi:hypothetical protein